MSTYFANKDDELEKKITEMDNKIRTMRKEYIKLLLKRPELKVNDYQFIAPDGQTMTLSELFGEGDELIIVHNMGKNCPYCNLWAHGYNDVYPYIKDRVPFFVVSPDKPEIQREVINERNYTFPMLSAFENTFIEDMGFKDSESYMPGLSVFRKDEKGIIFRTAFDYFGPGDFYNNVWHFFDLLPNGTNKWYPKLNF